MTWTPETNRIPWELMTPEEQAAMKAAKHGWEFWYYLDWAESTGHIWIPPRIYRARPAPAAKTEGREGMKIPVNIHVDEGTILLVRTILRQTSKPDAIIDDTKDAIIKAISELKGEKDD